MLCERYDRSHECALDADQGHHHHRHARAEPSAATGDDHAPKYHCSDDKGEVFQRVTPRMAQRPVVSGREMPQSERGGERAARRPRGNGRVGGPLYARHAADCLAQPSARRKRQQTKHNKVSVGNRQKRRRDQHEHEMLAHMNREKHVGKRIDRREQSDRQYADRGKEACNPPPSDRPAPGPGDHRASKTASEGENRDDKNRFNKAVVPGAGLHRRATRGRMGEGEAAALEPASERQPCYALHARTIQGTNSANMTATRNMQLKITPAKARNRVRPWPVVSATWWSPGPSARARDHALAADANAASASAAAAIPTATMARCHPAGSPPHCFEPRTTDALSCTSHATGATIRPKATISHETRARAGAGCATVDAR